MDIIDLMDFSRRQGRYSGSSGMRRCLKIDRPNGGNLVQIGLLGYTYTSVEQYQLGDKLGLHRITAVLSARLLLDCITSRVISQAQTTG